MKRIFLLGDEWLYYKLYCGARMSSIILTETIKPLVEELLKTNHISHWFFIRYNDPDYHLRIRFHLTDVNKINEVILLINKTIRPYVDEDIIYKVQVDTYAREIERYGSNTIALSEALFYHESTMLVEGMSMIEDEKLYFLFILKAVHQLLNDCQLSIKEKSVLVTGNKDGFRKEFNADKHLTKQLNKKYSGIRKEMNMLLDATYQNHEAFEYLDALVLKKSNTTKPLIEKLIDHQANQSLEMPWASLLSSYIHMMVNRAFRSQQRFYELVVYDFLTKKYKSDMQRVRAH